MSQEIYWNLARCDLLPDVRSSERDWFCNSFRTIMQYVKIGMQTAHWNQGGIDNIGRPPWEKEQLGTRILVTPLAPVGWCHAQ